MCICLLHCVSKKVPTFKLSVTLSNVNRFLNFLHFWKAYEICYKPIQHYPPHLRHVATLPWKIKQIFSAYGKKCKQIAFSSPLPFYSSTNFDIFSVKNSEFFPILIANKMFHVTILLHVYFCDQLVSPKICHSRRHSSVCQQSIWYSVTRTRF